MVMENKINRQAFVNEVLHEAKFVANATWDKEVKTAYLDLLKFLVNYVKVTKDKNGE